MILALVLGRLAPCVLLATAALALTACGSKGIDVPAADPNHRGAVLFAERCSGCHTLSAAGTQGSGNRSLRVQGPNLDQRKESVRDVLFAIRNGGFSGAIMPQNIVVGDGATAVARFVAKYSGSEAKTPPRPRSDTSARPKSSGAQPATTPEPSATTPGTATTPQPAAPVPPTSPQTTGP
jgi:mono/diheme cytochrome c family protein